MKAIAYLVIALTLLVSVSGQAQEPGSNVLKKYCDPDPDQIAVFLDDAYRKFCRIYGVGEYPVSALGPGSCDNCISSVRVGTRVKTLLCKDANFGGRCQLFTQDVPSLANSSLGNDSVSSIRVVRSADPETASPCTPNSDEIVLFLDINFHGACVVLGPGEYPDAVAIGLPNDSVSSIKVGDNAVGILCVGADGDGASFQHISGTDRDASGCLMLPDSLLTGPVNINDLRNLDLNDKTSSVKVRLRVQLVPPQ
jgi:hypothetical protein